MSATTPPNPGQAAATLHVLSGPHARSSIELPLGSTAVGADSGNDVVLADRLLAPFHFTLDCADARLRLHATGGPILMRGTVLRPGGSASCRDGMILQAGGTSFRLTSIARQLPTTRTARSAVFATGMACAVVGIGFLAMQAAGRADATTPPPSAASAAPVRPEAGSGGSAAALAALRERLATMNLGGIAVTALADGSVAARGEIMSQQMEAWHDAQRWFDGAYGVRSVLVNQVTASAAMTPLAIQAVWPGADPYVIDGAGQKLFVGAMLPTGWTLQQIERDRVVVKRGGQTLSVRF